MADSTFTIQQNTVNGLVSTLDGKASVDLSNSPYTTNRILEIPQDIKLELSNGTLTLKAGSKVYVPNGFEADGTTPHFDVVTIQNDISTNYASYSDYDDINICLKTDGTFATYFKAGNQSSGTSGVAYNFVYRTDLNKMYDYEASASTPYEQMSFPIGRFKYQNNGIAAIHQVFNGFGYIGSTVFVLPGVKVQIPDGKNEDGTCKDILWTSSRVFISAPANWNSACVWVVGAESEGYPVGPVGAYDWHYNSETNYNEFTGYPQWPAVPCAYGVVSSTGVISSFTPCYVDVIANSNASNFSSAGRSYLAEIGMPSDKYIDLTLGTTGSTYIAPANGYVILNMQTTTASYSFVYIIDDTTKIASLSGIAIANNSVLACLPIKKGKSFRVSYTAQTKNYFRFIYAEGEV